MACPPSFFNVEIEITLKKAKDPPASVYGNIDAGNTNSDHIFQKTREMAIDVGPGEIIALTKSKVLANNSAFNVYANLLDARDFSIIVHGTASFVPSKGSLSTTIGGGSGELGVKVTFT